MGVEIERVFLLSALPPQMPAGEEWHIDQGYLQPEAAGPLSEGRLRRIAHPDGRLEHIHTVKRGVGRVREEHEQHIDAAAFEAAWPRTHGRRIRKIRTRIAQGPLTWEIDRFLDLPLVLAECELPTADAALPIPPWLQPLIVREVTDEPEYRNYALAARAGLGGKSA